MQEEKTKTKSSGRKRKHRLTVSFNDRELEIINRKASMITFPREVMMREILLGAEIKERPPLEYAAILTELRTMGNRIYNLIVKEMQTKFVDVVILQDIYDELVKIDRIFSSAFIMKRK